MTRASMQHEHTALARDAIRCVRATASGCGIAGPAALRLADAADVLIEEIERLRAALGALGVAIADAGYTWTPEMRAAYEKGEK